MKDLQKRFLLFLIGCIGVRVLFVIYARNNPDYLPIMGLLALIPALGFMYIYMNDLRKTGTEVFGDKIWWNNLRPVHGLLYGLFAITALNNQSYAWIFLLIDVLIGLSSWLYHHYSHGNFYKLFTE